MKEILRQTIYNIGNSLCELGEELRNQALDPYRPMNFHGDIIQKIQEIAFYLNALNARLYKLRKEELKKTKRIDIHDLCDIITGKDIEITYNAAKNLSYALYQNETTVRSDASFKNEIEKLQWLLADILNVYGKPRREYKDKDFYEII